MLRSDDCYGKGHSRWFLLFSHSLSLPCGSSHGHSGMFYLQVLSHMKAWTSFHVFTIWYRYFVWFLLSQCQYWHNLTRTHVCMSCHLHPCGLQLLMCYHGSFLLFAVRTTVWCNFLKLVQNGTIRKSTKCFQTKKELWFSLIQSMGCSLDQNLANWFAAWSGWQITSVILVQLKLKSLKAWLDGKAPLL